MSQPIVMKTAEAVVRTLEESGVNLIFGLPGSQTTPLYDALYSSRIKHVLVKHEQAAAYMADAYAKFTGRVGVCDGTGGPGATNLLTGVATAWTDRTPVLTLTGQQPLEESERGAFQWIDHVALFTPVVKESVQVTRASTAATVVREALAKASTGRPGPVHVDLPVEVQREEVQFGQETTGSCSVVGPTRPTKALIDRAASLLVEALNPVFIAGGGVHYAKQGAWKELVSLAEYLAAPIVTTFNGRGVIPEDHSLSGGRMGVHARPYTDRLLQRAGVILSAGCRFSSLSTRHWKAPQPFLKLIQVDIDPDEIGRNYHVALGLIGDAATVLNDLLAEVRTLIPARSSESSTQLAELRRAKEEWLSYCDAFLSQGGHPVKPQRLCLELRRSFPRETVFTMDAGNNKMWAATFLDVYGPRTWIQSGAFGPMGYALPAAIACKLAKRDIQVVALTGDGGFVMTMYELATVAQENLAVLVCIMDDQALGTIRHQQRSDFGGRFISTSLRNPDFVKLAEAYSCFGERVEETGQIRGALERASNAVRGGSSAIIDVAIDGEEPLPP